ncbi:uncharacterized protein BCR38DRAFT_475958 [Pseudomassariella vexata]|uniref:Uncharacterized protein n=1 Tax=Pseudomassariella vexata TaxID=1141098 RepID=A0A1Y2DTP5_9PEZI|nr:uncharacterized protein BCR38DRAFT_475958 [Pseudomassariella vexata]ORY62653.1 hypothetical protein BCR38DRAFT_475958 [Pseudomassariella vexata]
MPPYYDTSPQAQWPPQSPHDVLASTPGGRERLRRLAERTSPSPSPLKKSRPASALVSRSRNSQGIDLDDDDVDMDEEDDEETLQLKLQAIEAKLKLKSLQKKQKKVAHSASDVENGYTRSSIRPDMRPNIRSRSIPDVLAASRAQSRAAILREGPDLRPQSQAEVQVPASPVRRHTTAHEQRSPSRVLLGIDKGLRAKDVSLKRASSMRKPHETQNGQGGYLRRAHTPGSSQESQERPMSFSEKLAAARSEETSRRDRQARINQIRSKTFDVKQDDVERFKARATELPDIPSQSDPFSRDEVMAGGALQRNNTVPSIRVRATQLPESASMTTPTEAETIPKPVRKQQVAPADVPEDEATSFEPFSTTHLAKRILPHSVLTRTFSGKKTYIIKDLLSSVKAPNFELPEVEQDIVVLGILASKSEPKSHQPVTNPKLREKKGRFDNDDDQRGKYMVLKIVDLQYELELFLFNTAFDRYWKLTPGTLIAILNPTVMPPPKGREHTGRFSLVLNSDGDSVLEIGTARDLGFCKSIKKDGALCNSWVNKKRTEFCEFHMNTALDRKRLARQEINSGSGIGPRDKNSRERWIPDKKKEEEHKKRGNYDAYTHSHFFVSQASTASLLDSHTLPGQMSERVERKDALRRRLATEEKERDIMKQLGNTGRGAGRDYMRQKLGSSMSSAADSSATTVDERPQPDAKSLGLLQGRGTKIHLSPVKRKRVNSAFNSVSSNASSSFPGANNANNNDNNKNNNKSGFGWGNPLKDKLTRMKEGEKLDGSAAPSTMQTSFRDKTKDKVEQPARKKTRFVTAKGIREAGRESLGGELCKGDRMVDLDDDDELVILR